MTGPPAGELARRLRCYAISDTRRGKEEKRKRRDKGMGKGRKRICMSFMNLSEFNGGQGRGVSRAATNEERKNAK